MLTHLNLKKDKQRILNEIKVVRLQKAMNFRKVVNTDDKLRNLKILHYGKVQSNENSTLKYGYLY